jgi:ADP-heptose:LPS heptosyltransferase
MKRRIILHQGQSPGDITVFTGAVRDLKYSYPQFEIDVRTPCQFLFEYNPHLTPLDDKAKDVEHHNIGYDSIHQSGWRCHHFSDSFREEIQNKLNSRSANKIKINKTSILPDIHISEEEKKWTNQVAWDLQYPGKFWLINAGSKPDCILKQYPPEYYQEVVKLLKDKVQFVQIGDSRHNHPKLEGVLNLVGKTEDDPRKLVRLMWWAEGVVTPISYPMVLAAAFQKPAVVIAGGKEPLHWQAYPNHRFLYTNGALRCCHYDGCWKSEYKECVNRVGGHPRCYMLIRPEDVARAVELYYLGGALTYDHMVVHDWRPHATQSKIG